MWLGNFCSLKYSKPIFKNLKLLKIIFYLEYKQLWCFAPTAAQKGQANSVPNAVQSFPTVCLNAHFLYKATVIMLSFSSPILTSERTQAEQSVQRRNESSKAKHIVECSQDNIFTKGSTHFSAIIELARSYICSTRLHCRGLHRGKREKVWTAKVGAF